jgi:hypothetical protein
LKKSSKKLLFVCPGLGGRMLGRLRWTNVFASFSFEKDDSSWLSGPAHGR